MRQIQIVLDSETLYKLDACARFRKISREQLLKEAIDETVRNCYNEASLPKLEESPPAGIYPEAGVFSRNV